MFELICMSLLGVAYIHARVEEAAEEKRKEAKRKRKSSRFENICLLLCS